MKPYYEEEGITIYHGDCQVLIMDGLHADVLITDPPYGIGWSPRINHRGSNQIWIDSESFDPTFFMSRFQKHLFWGGNYFCHLLPPTESWFIWMKRPIHLNFEMDRRSYSMAEMAWSDFGTKPLVKVHVWDGGMRAGDPQNRTFCHPAQKPLEIMMWCIAESDGSIIDPFMGSGTTLVAARQMGRSAIGIEIEERYCEMAAKRLSQMVMRFEPNPSVLQDGELI